ncbi:hypothetical protein ACFX13_040644 [Malus domestica]
MESSSSSAKPYSLAIEGGKVLGQMFETANNVSFYRRKLDDLRLSEENIPLVTPDASPNDADEEQVPYVAARESEAPTDSLALADNSAPANNSAGNLAKEHCMRAAAGSDSVMHLQFITFDVTNM